MSPRSGGSQPKTTFSVDDPPAGKSLLFNADISNDLLEDVARGGYQGIGKPEPLKGDLSGYWNRRIDDKNRLVYRMLNGDLCNVIQCKGHYGE